MHPLATQVSIMYAEVTLTLLHLQQIQTRYVPANDCLHELSTAEILLKGLGYTLMVNQDLSILTVEQHLTFKYTAQLCSYSI